MRATQFVRRGLIAFATVALFSTGLAGAASAQNVGCGTAGIGPNGDAIVVGAVPGFNCTLISTPGFGESAILGVSIVPGAAPVVIKFIPDVNGAGVLNPAGDDVIAHRP